MLPFLQSPPYLPPLLLLLLLPLPLLQLLPSLPPPPLPLLPSLSSPPLPAVTTIAAVSTVAAIADAVVVVLTLRLLLVAPAARLNVADAAIPSAAGPVVVVIVVADLARLVVVQPQLTARCSR